MSQNAARQEAQASQKDSSTAEAARTQAPVGAHTNLVHLAESCPDAAYEENERRQDSAPENVHTSLRASQQAMSAGRQSSQEAESAARANFEARVALVDSMNSELPPGHQEYDIGLFATKDPSYMPCGVAYSTYSRPVAKFDQQN